MKTVPLALVPGQLELVRPPAPGNLELVRRFINTRDVEKETDALATPAGVLGFLREYRLADGIGRVTADEAAGVRDVREALRTLSGLNNGLGGSVPAERLDEASRRARLHLRFEPSGASELVPATDGVDGAVGRILAAVHRAHLDGTWPRLKVCADDSCSWSYYDSSKNGCSRWCTTEICGNRNKVKRYRERQAQAGT